MKITVAKNGEYLGPYTVEEIKELLLAGKIKNYDWAWPEDASDWVPVGSIVGGGDSPSGVPPVEQNQSAGISFATSESANTDIQGISEQAVAGNCLAAKKAQEEEFPQNKQTAAVQEAATRIRVEHEATESREIEAGFSEIGTESEQCEETQPVWEHGHSFAHITDPARRRRAIQEERRYLQAIRDDERKQERERRKLEREMEKENKEQQASHNRSLMASMCVYLSDDGASQPVKFAVIAGLIKSGVLPEDTEVCFVGTDRWVRANAL